MDYNMTFPEEKYIPTEYNGENVDLMQWLQNDEVNHAVNNILVSTDTNINVNANDNANAIDNGKRKRRPRNSDLSRRKKATKKTATAASPQQVVSAGTTQIQEKIAYQQDKTKQKETHLIQHEENADMFSTLSLELNDIQSTYQQMCAIREKYVQDLNIQGYLNACVEMWNGIVSDIEKRMKQIPFCKMCLKSPTTNPQKVVGVCGHKFCCKSCVSDFFKRMAEVHGGKQLCLACNVETDVTVFK